MLTFSTHSPEEVSSQLAARVRERRLAKGWSRQELSARSGVAFATLQKFEQTGHISLERLLRIAAALNVLSSFQQLVPAEDTPRSLADLEAATVSRQRLRGRTRREFAPASGIGARAQGSSPRQPANRTHGA